MAESACPEGARSVELACLSWTEIASAVQDGTVTILVPIGGTEQSGPYMAVGKHNIRAQALADRIARQMGHTLVAPVIAYVPEGGTQPRTSHMRFAGTISVPPAVFSGVLEGAAESFRVQGFRRIVFLGDHGGYQALMRETAARLDRSWARAGNPAARAFALDAYYQAVPGAFADALRGRGLGAYVGLHAELSDTSLMLAVDPTLVREDALRHAPKPGTADGVYGGDPRPASAALGQIGTDLQVEAAIRQLQEFEGGTR